MIPIQFITHQNERYSYEESALLALEGGCRWIQLRMKGAADDEVEPIARRLKAACRERDAVFVIDDRVALVKAIDADGVHLGRKDMPVAEARALLGEGFLIGGTANTIDDIRALHRASADYIGCGPFRYTTTKQGLAPLLGLEGLRRLMEIKKQEQISIPVCAIGGITLSDVPDVMATGVNGIAVSGAVLQAADPVRAMRDLLHADES
jgi:thiamine-phosphate pyrophosphorylase